MADLLALKQQIEDSRERAIWMPLRHPLTNEVIGGAEKPAEIQLLSAECKAYRDAERAYSAQRTLSKANGAEFTQRDIAAHEKHTLNKLVLVTKDWRNIEEGDQPIACTPDNVRKWYAIDWIYSQVFIQVHSLSDYGIEGEAPKDIVEDEEKKSETGLDGSSPSVLASDQVQ